MHGNAKSPEDLLTAVRPGVGRIVVDSASEIARLSAITPAGTRQQVMIRVVPGIAAGGHAKVRTGTDDQKFGLSITDGSAQHAVARVLGQPPLELVGLHCHIGSQVATVKPYVAAVRRMIGLMVRIRDQHGIALPQLDIGGGHAIAYRPGEQSHDVGILAGRIRAELEDGCAKAKLPVPRLTLEQGRAVIGPAGVAIYRVLAVKRTGEHTFVAVDGGMSDNPGRRCTGCGTRPGSSAAPRRSRPALSLWSAGTARRATYWRTVCHCPVTYARATCSRYPRPVRTTCPWPPVTTLSAARPSSPSRTARHECSYAVNRWTT